MKITIKEIKSRDTGRYNSSYRQISAHGKCSLTLIDTDDNELFFFGGYMQHTSRDIKDNIRKAVKRIDNLKVGDTITYESDCPTTIYKARRSK